MSREQAKRIADALENRPDLLTEVLHELEGRKTTTDGDKGYGRGRHHAIAQQVAEWTDKYGMRKCSWHEPDEQDVAARVLGTQLDNACGNDVREEAIAEGYQELVVEVFHQVWEDDSQGHIPDGDSLRVNLADLFAIVDRYYREHVAPGK